MSTTSVPGGGLGATIQNIFSTALGLGQKWAEKELGLDSAAKAQAAVPVYEPAPGYVQTGTGKTLEQLKTENMQKYLLYGIIGLVAFLALR